MKAPGYPVTTRLPRSAVALLPAGLAALVLGAAALLLAPARALDPDAALVAACLALAMAGASLYRPLGGTLPGFGGLAVPGLIAVVGAVHAPWVAAAAYLLGDLVRRVLRTLSPLGRERRGGLRAIEGAGRTALATLAAALAWGVAGDAGPPWRAPAGAALAYLVTLAALVILAARLRRSGSAGWGWSRLPPLALDAGGWLVGALLVQVGQEAGWEIAVLLAWGLAFLALEAGRFLLLYQALERRTLDLERLSRASHRLGTAGGAAPLAVQVRTECRRVIDFHWFQLLLEEEGGGARSWWASPDGAIHGGAPSPPPAPPPLPGIHRRRRWRVIERQLLTGERRLGALFLWCDPRQVTASDLEMLDNLVPQLAAWVHRTILDREAHEDPLTGIPVRRQLERVLAETFGRTLAGGGPVSVVLCDVDHFKGINDSFGHAAGDRALVAVARTLEAHRRGSDLCARYGGEEFALVLVDTDGAAALAVAERLRTAIAALVVEEKGEALPLAVSAGVASFPELWAAAPGELLALADEALYEAKRRGRNRCLLNLGRGRYRTPGGEDVGERSAPAEAPRIFA